MSNTTEKKNMTHQEAAVEDLETLSGSESASGGEVSGRRRKKNRLRVTSLTAIAVTVILAIMAILTAAGLHDSRATEQERQRAENFAEQLQDTLQSMGQSRVETQFWNGFSYKDQKGNIDLFDGMPFDIVDDYDQIGPADSRFQMISKEKGTEIPGTGEVQRYTILGTGYKGDEYDVQIKYDPSGYGEDSTSDSHAYNVNNFPDISSLTSENTAIINPEGAYVKFSTDASGSYEYDDTSQQFKSETRTLETSVLDNMYAKRSSFYEEAVSLVNSTLAQTEIHNWNKLTGTSFYTTTDKSQKVIELRKKITRNTAILAQGSEGNATVTSAVLFNLTDPSYVGDPQRVINAIPEVFANATITEMVDQVVEVTPEEAEDTENTQNQTSPEGGAAEPVPQTKVIQVPMEVPVPEEWINALTDSLKTDIEALYESATSDDALTEQFMVYESDRAFVDLENIYLMYYPLRNGQWKSDTISIDISRIRNQYKKTHKLNLYVVPQLGLLASSKTAYESIQASEYIAPKLGGGDISFDGASRTMKVGNEGALFDIPRIRVNYVKGYMRPLAAVDMKDSITGHTDPEDILYALNLKIYRASKGRFPEGDLLAESTVTSS